MFTMISTIALRECNRLGDARSKPLADVPERSNPSDLSRTEQQEVWSALDTCLSGLPPKRQLLARLHFVEGLKNVEISRRLSTAKSFVTEQLNLARKWLRSCLAKKGFILEALKLLTTLQSRESTSTVTDDRNRSDDVLARIRKSSALRPLDAGEATRIELVAGLADSKLDLERSDQNGLDDALTAVGSDIAAELIAGDQAQTQGIKVSRARPTSPRVLRIPATLCAVAAALIVVSIVLLWPKSGRETEASFELAFDWPSDITRRAPISGQVPALQTAGREPSWAGGPRSPENPIRSRLARAAVVVRDRDQTTEAVCHSGVVVDSGHIVTLARAVARAVWLAALSGTAAQVTVVSFDPASDRWRESAASVLRFDPVAGLAVLTVDSETARRGLTLGNQPPAGSAGYAVGAPERRAPFAVEHAGIEAIGEMGDPRSQSVLGFEHELPPERGTLLYVATTYSAGLAGGALTSRDGRLTGVLLGGNPQRQNEPTLAIPVSTVRDALVDLPDSPTPMPPDFAWMGLPHATRVVAAGQVPESGDQLSVHVFRDSGGQDIAVVAYVFPPSVSTNEVPASWHADHPSLIGSVALHHRGRVLVAACQHQKLARARLDSNGDGIADWDWRRSGKGIEVTRTTAPLLSTDFADAETRERLFLAWQWLVQTH